jgi:hypothetical protein
MYSNASGSSKREEGKRQVLNEAAGEKKKEEAQNKYSQ